MELPLRPCTKRPPVEVGTLLGVLLCLLALAVTVKPLADVVGDYTRCDRHKETGYGYVH